MHNNRKDPLKKRKKERYPLNSGKHESKLWREGENI
jgi:hypothetical protein